MANNGYDSSSSDETGVSIMFLEMLENYRRKKAAKKKEKTSMVVHGGTSSRRRTIPGDRVSAHENLFQNYFSNHLLYPPSDFRNRFRMRRELFNRIMEQIVPFDDYFKQKLDATGKLGFLPQVKMTVAMRMLAYGTAADLNDDYLKIAETTSFEACKRLCHAVNNIYGAKYLRKPTRVDLQKLLQKAEERGFLGMLGSLDCMHWEWKNCPMSHHGAYTGHHGRPTIILEAVASYDTWIWHANFGMPGVYNDLNVLYKSPFFDDVFQGRAPRVRYYLNGKQYKQGYYLADGIYPKWNTIAFLFSSLAFLCPIGLHRGFEVCGGA